MTVTHINRTRRKITGKRTHELLTSLYAGVSADIGIRRTKWSDYSCADFTERYMNVVQPTLSLPVLKVFGERLPLSPNMQNVWQAIDRIAIERAVDLTVKSVTIIDDQIVVDASIDN